MMLKEKKQVFYPILIVLIGALVASFSLNVLQFEERGELERRIDFLRERSEVLSDGFYWLDEQIGKYPVLEVFTRKWLLDNSTVYCVAESKEGWENGVYPILFQSSDGTFAFQWAINHVNKTLVIIGNFTDENGGG